MCTSKGDKKILTNVGESAFFRQVLYRASLCPSAGDTTTTRIVGRDAFWIAKEKGHESRHDEKQCQADVPQARCTKSQQCGRHTQDQWHNDIRKTFSDDTQCFRLSFTHWSFVTEMRNNDK